MDHYHIWFNLKDSHRDLEFCENLNAYLGHLKGEGKIAGFSLSRRKLGFGPHELGEFHVDVQVTDLAHLDQAFLFVAPRAGGTERLHAAVYGMITDFRAALYRDFPDSVRAPAKLRRGSVSGG